MSKEINNPSRSELITDFVKTNPNYYIDQFQKIDRIQQIDPNKRIDLDQQIDLDQRVDQDRS